MPIFLFDIFGSSSIGVFIRVTEDFMIVPHQVPEGKVKKLEDWFEMRAVRTNVAGSVLTGTFVCANSYGMVLPRSVWNKELEALKSFSDINITIAQTKKTAYGNLVLANDYGAVADPRLTETSKNEAKAVSDTLGVEVVSGEIAGLPYVGSLAAATNKGVLAHPLIKTDEERLLEEVLRVPVGIGTINCGIPYIATGLIGNSKVAVTGSLTKGPELFMIGQALNVAD